jgi:hypothetical protein
MANSPNFPEKLDVSLGDPIYSTWALSQLIASEYGAYRALADWILPFGSWEGSISEIQEYLQINMATTRKYLRSLHKKKFIGFNYVKPAFFDIYWVRQNSLEVPLKFEPKHHIIVDPSGKHFKVYVGKYAEFAEQHGLSVHQVQNLVSGRVSRISNGFWQLHTPAKRKPRSDRQGVKEQ